MLISSCIFLLWESTFAAFFYSAVQEMLIYPILALYADPLFETRRFSSSPAFFCLDKLQDACRGPVPMDRIAK